MVVINASDKRVRLPAADGYRLHPVLKDSVDPINRQATVSNGMFEVPAFTTTVFVQPQPVDKSRAKGDHRSPKCLRAL